MQRTNPPVIAATVLSEETLVPIAELCRACDAQIEWIVELVDQGVLEPTGAEPKQWHFASIALRWTRVAVSLHRDLGLNAAGVAMVIEMKQELDRLRMQLQTAQPWRFDDE